MSVNRRAMEIPGVLHLDDQENAVRANPKTTLLRSNTDENYRQPLKLGQQPPKSRQAPLKLRQRVPLGGKDQNAAFPTLQRSQTAQTLGPRPSFPVQRKKVLLPRAPLLTKANSSLGIVHHRSLVNDRPLADRWMPAAKPQVNPFNNSLLHKKNEPQPFTDSLERVIDHTKAYSRSEVPTLQSTFSRNLEKLHAKHKTSHDVNTNNVDPVKKAHAAARRKPVLEIPQALIDDPESVELIPDAPLPVPYHPVDMEPSTASDLELFSHPHKFTVTLENEYEYPEVHQNEIKLQFREIDLDRNLDFGDEEMEEENDMDIDSSRVGLNAQELNDLLDF